MISTRRLAWAALALWAGTVAAAGWFFYRGVTAPATDRRTEVLLSVSERDMVLGEMRSLLNALSGTLAGLGAGDRQAAAAAARGGGMGMAADETPALIGKLPASFKQMGMGMHRSFDDLADALSRGEETQQVLRRMGALTGQCVGCHQLYRLGAHEGRSPRP